LIEEDNTPVFLIHGTEDDIVYFKKGMPLESLAPESDALEFSIPEAYGSFCLDTALENRQIKHSTYFVPGKKHEFYGVATGMFGDDGPNEYWDTIQWKISDFLLDIFRPVPDFKSQNNGLTVQFTNESSDAYYSEWDFGDNSKSSEENPAHTYQQSGNYKVRLKACNKNMACDTLTQTISLTQVGLLDEVENEIRIYPVPARNYIIIEGIQSNYSGKILDITGRTRTVFSGTESQQIDLMELEEGIFIVMVESENKKVIKKFLKQK